MAAARDRDARPLRSRDELLEPFLEACKPRDQWRVGTEAEKHAIFTDGRALPFEGERSVQTVLARMQASGGWKPYREHDGGPMISLLRKDASITLEPGGQLELSGAPLRTIHETRAEMDVHHAELRPIEQELGIRWLGLGFHPLARRDDLPWVPKLRYPVMRAYLPSRGVLAHDMMLRTCTVQSNHDYASEEDAMRKLRVSLRVQPIATALFANSPIVEGVATGERTRRGAVWLAVDPDRSGLLPFAWKPNARFEDYVEWALDVPMFLVKREGRFLPNTGQTFRSFMSSGFEGERANADDWLTHLNTLFPEVRLKKTLEMRGADSQRGDLVCALPALWKGILHDEVSLAETEALGERWDHDTLERTRASIAHDGLSAQLAGAPVREWAIQLVDIARRGLARLGDLDPVGRDETIHIAPLETLLAKGRTPADELLAHWNPSSNPVPQLLEYASL